MAMDVAFPIALAWALMAGEGPPAVVPSLTMAYYADNEPRVLRPSEPGPPMGNSYELDTLPLVLTEPSRLRLGDSTYSLDREGLYRVRLEESSKIVRQTIFYRGDVWRFAGHLSRLYVYGRRHQGEAQTKWDERARDGEPLSLQCGSISAFVHHHLSAQKVPSRLVSCVTGSDWNHCDDGHALMEIRDPSEGRWALFDPTLGARFRNEGRLLDLLEATRLYRTGGRAERVEFVNASSKLDPLEDYERLFAKAIPDEGDLAALLTRFRPLLRNDVATIHRWYGRVMQVPLIGNRFVPASDAEDALLRTIPSWKDLVRMSAPQFRDFYYGRPSGQAADAVTPASPSR